MKFLVPLLIFSFCAEVHARWMTRDEAEAVLESQINLIHVKKDGRALSESQIRLKILNEKGRVHFGTLRYSYTPKNDKFQIIDPETINGTQKFSVSSSDMVDSPIQATEGGFDELRQVVVSFPQVQVGSELSFKIKNETHLPAIANQFSERFVMGQNYPSDQVQFKIYSEVPLFIQINDPTEAIEFTKNEKLGENYYFLSLKKPVFHEVVDEVRGVIPFKSLTWFVISTSSSYQAMYSNLATTYEKMLQAPLPKIFEPILDLARDTKDPILQMNQVLSAIADKVRYMGDWRSVDGGFVPRSLDTIASTHFGDCKDMSLLTSKILRLLGFEAHISLVQRSPLPEQLPEVPFIAFNHAIVSVTLSETLAAKLHKHQLWLDPTNFQSYAQGVMDDISDRTTLLMTAPTPSMETINFTEPKESMDVSVFKYRFNNELHRFDEISIHQTGIFAAQHTGISLNYSDQQIEDEIVNSNVDKGDVFAYHFSPYNLKSRIVSDIDVKWSVDHRYPHASTSTGPGFTLKTPLVMSDLNRVDIEQRQSNLSLGLPSMTEGRGSISNFEIIGKHIRNCKIRSPWLDYTLNLKANSLPVTLEDELVIKTRFITASEIHSPEFQKLIQAARICSSDQLLIYRVPKIIDHK